MKYHFFIERIPAFKVYIELTFACIIFISQVIVVCLKGIIAIEVFIIVFNGYLGKEIIEYLSDAVSFR